MHPQTLSSNMLIAFFVSIIEDYFKSCFVALLKYSPEKEKFLRGVRLRSDQIARVSDGKENVEQVVAETLSFQRISIACKNFEAIDRALAGALRKPYNRRRLSLYDQLEQLTDSRNRFVHRADLDLSLTNVAVDAALRDVEVAMTRVQRAILKRHSWEFYETWGIGRVGRKTE
jgi:hypothetical protein